VKAAIPARTCPSSVIESELWQILIQVKSRLQSRKHQYFRRFAGWLQSSRAQLLKRRHVPLASRIRVRQASGGIGVGLPRSPVRGYMDLEAH